MSFVFHRVLMAHAFRQHVLRTHSLDREILHRRTFNSDKLWKSLPCVGTASLRHNHPSFRKCQLPFGTNYFPLPRVANLCITSAILHSYIDDVLIIFD